MGEAFRESAPVADGASIRQGDIFVFRDGPAGDDMWQKAGIIVTADCDIANDKHGGILSYVPILSLRDYLAWRVLPRIADDRRRRILRDMSDTVGRLEADRGIKPGLSARAVEVCANVENGLTDLCAHLGEVASKDTDVLAAMIDDIAQCGRALRSPTYGEQFAALTSVFRPTKKKSAEELLLGEIRSRLKNLPGDVFFISSLDHEHTEGFIAYLRLIRETSLRSLSTSYYDKDGRNVVAHRTSRLLAPYVYRLTQQMADVFASIGLPEEYEAARDSIFDSHLTPGPTWEMP
ncbi:hypothetical protein COO58_13395 [Micromonospora sp. WMMA1996]|uniref:hypothetical protein n=1 Tax=Micromonospora sp. WMMA1996 TaxID=2039878 RepID=UPI000BF84F5F|nr:hypothetical protein [Micromonospora sp. WMMA1996]PGH45309.1 hypothetical protein COO58_13395 [Micromonospora sp. WMMA1996]